MRCKVCSMLPSSTLEAALRSKPSREVAKEFGVSKSTVNNHRNNCSNFEHRIAPEEGQEVVWKGDSGEIRTGIMEHDLSGKSHEEILQAFGHDPEKVEISTVLWEKHKQYWDRDREEMVWKHSYSFGITKKKQTASEGDVDVLELMQSFGFKVENQQTVFEGSDSSFTLDWADWQIGKNEGGGSEAFLFRFDSAIEAAIARVHELRKIGRKLDELVIFGGGDMIEGCVIYPQQSFHIDLNRREQVRLTVALILKGLYNLAPLFERVRVVVVPGNHGENRINGNRTAISDNDDLLVFEMAEVGLQNDPNMQHVSFEIAESEVSMVTDIRGWKYGITHGDVYGKSGGSGIRNKVFNWVRTMAANRHPVGLVDVLVTHHYHHDALEDWGSMLWVQNPTMDGGSHYYKEATGHYAKSGMNSWVVTTEERFQDKQVLR